MLNNNAHPNMVMTTKASLIQNLNYHSKVHSNSEKDCTYCGNFKRFKLPDCPDWWDGLN